VLEGTLSPHGGRPRASALSKRGPCSFSPARIVLTGDVMRNAIDATGAGRAVTKSFLLLLSVAVIVLGGGSCRGSEQPPVPRSGRVLIIGIDGASPMVIDSMFAAGRMQNLRRIAENGAYGPLKSESFPLSPRVWTTIATGKSPEKHGINGWVKVGTDAKADLYYSSDRKGLALWNMLSDAGKSVAVVNWLITYPPEKINGVMVTDHALAREIEGKKWIGETFAKSLGAELNPVRSAENGAPAVYPPEWADRALATKHSEAVLTNVASPFLETSPDIAFKLFYHNLRDFWDTDQRLASITKEILGEKSPDVAMVLLQGIDRTSHFLFGCLGSPTMYPAEFHPTFEQRVGCQRALYDYYEFTDQLIGHLLMGYGDNDLVMVISDHGFEPFFRDYRTGDHRSEAATYGVCLARGPRVKKDGNVVGMTVADVTPTVLEWYGLPLGQDMDGKPAPFLDAPVTPSPAPIATYDTKAVERLGDGASGGEQKVKEQLKSLGYLQ
jgi:predicted AlkP superfamily phosphohydrolase/phosphomutase